MKKKLHVILQRSLVEARNLALGNRCEQIHDLADTFEVFPGLLLSWTDGHLDRVRELLQGYQSRNEAAYDYLSILNMDDSSFDETYQLD